MSQYAKIDTLFARRPDFKVDTTCVRRPEFEAIDRWQVDEKLDGMNIRLILRTDKAGGHADVCGRTDRAVVPENLTRAICGSPANIPWPLRDGQHGLVVYGEGLGPKINGNPHGLGHYEFKVFDARPLIMRSFETGHVDEEDIVETHISYNECVGAWLEREDVRDVAAALGLEMVPDLGVWTEDEVVEMVQWPDNNNAPYFEGVVCRPLTELSARGKRVIWKLKVRDFKEGR